MNNNNKRKLNLSLNQHDFEREYLMKEGGD